MMDYKEYLKQSLIVFRRTFKNELNVCEHSEDDGINIYHAEGDVYTHTMMVVKYYIDNFYYDFPPNLAKAGLVACLGHDLGKPFCRHNRDGRTFMTGHELISTMKTLDILSDFKDTFELSDNESDLALFAIISHTLAHSKSLDELCKSDDQFKVLNALNQSDQNGRINLNA
jgi:hypothetical protein